MRDNCTPWVSRYPISCFSTCSHAHLGIPICVLDYCSTSDITWEISCLLFFSHLIALRHEEVKVVAGERHLEVDLHQPQVGRVAVQAVHADDEVLQRRGSGEI